MERKGILDYQSPIVEIVEIEVEKGYAQSYEPSPLENWIND